MQQPDPATPSSHVLSQRQIDRIRNFLTSREEPAFEELASPSLRNAALAHLRRDAKEFVVPKEGVLKGKLCKTAAQMQQSKRARCDFSWALICATGRGRKAHQSNKRKNEEALSGKEDALSDSGMAIVRVVLVVDALL
jgi:hypothetical protein